MDTGSYQIGLTLGIGLGVFFGWLWFVKIPSIANPQPKDNKESE